MSSLERQLATECRTHQTVIESFASAEHGSLGAERAELLRRRKMQHNAFGREKKARWAVRL